MSNTGPGRHWIHACCLSWMLAAGATGGLVAVMAFGNGALVDEQPALIGIPVGAVLGFVGARAARRRSRLHRVLVVLGILLAVLGTAGTVWQFRAAGRHDGEMYSGLGDVIGGVFAIGVAVVGALWLVAGATGLRAARA